MVTAEELAEECVLPRIGRLRDTTAAVASAVAAVAFGDDLSTVTVDSAKWAAGGARRASGRAAPRRLPCRAAAALR
jgi:hypothetical protein